MCPKITVIVPVYNVEAYLPQCIESIQKQNYGSIQIILVDDGSTDMSGEICDSYAKKDGRIKVVHKSNGGLVSARKAGLSIADGQYVGFVDADDYIDENMYQEMMECMLDTDSDFVSSGIYEESTAGFLADIQKTFEQADRYQVIKEHLLDTGYRSFKGILPSLCVKLLKKELIQECYAKVSEQNNFGEDLVCTCRCVLSSRRFTVMNRRYYHYTHREGSISRNQKNNYHALRCTDLYIALYQVFQEYGCLDALHESLTKHHIRKIVASSGYDFKGLQLCRYPCPEKFYGMNIVIYGASDVGKAYYDQFSKWQGCRIRAVADSYPEKHPMDGVDVISLSELTSLDFDAVVIAVATERTAEEIKESLLSREIKEEKIYWKEPEFIF